MTYEQALARLKVEAWDGGDCVITLDGRPIGQPQTPRESYIVRSWLASALADILVPLEKEVATLHKILGDKVQDSDAVSLLVRTGTERAAVALEAEAEKCRLECVARSGSQQAADLGMQMHAFNRAADIAREAGNG